MRVLLTAIQEANMSNNPSVRDPRDNPVSARRIEWADDELRRHDAAVIRCWHACLNALEVAMAETGTDDERQRALDHLHDMLSDVFDGQRHDLLTALDEEGGNVLAHLCPITTLYKRATGA
jgi:hydroxyethylthiazole kinase-like sugar kinase family protein